MDPLNQEFDHELERELRQALVRRPAPPGLKARIMAGRRQRRLQSRHSHSILWMRLAASLLIAAVIAGAVRWDYERNLARRRGEQARQQVLPALPIPSHALDLVQQHLTARNRGNGDLAK